MTDTLTYNAKQLIDELYVYSLVRENGRVFEGRTEKATRAILESRYRARRMLWHRNEDKKIDGLFLWYRCSVNKDPSRFVDSWQQDDERGGILLLSALFADSPQILKWGVLQFIIREPDCLHLPLVSFRRGKLRYSNSKLLTKILKNGQA